MPRGWKYAAASVIGTSHLKFPGGECQDSHSCSCDESRDLLVCVVSDGAGSASHSAVGSQLASTTAVKLILDGPTELIDGSNFARDTAIKIRETIANAAEELGLPLRSFACTLLVAIVSGPTVTFWQIGDGAICFRLQGESDFHYAFWPAKGEYANVTQFVTDENFLEELEFDSSTAEIGDLALFTDGLERLALDFKTCEAHTKFFAGLFPHLYVQASGRVIEIEKQLTAFLSSERVNSKTDDDKTLILATIENQ